MTQAQELSYEAFQLTALLLATLALPGRLKLTCSHDRVELHDVVRADCPAFEVLADLIERVNG